MTKVVVGAIAGFILWSVLWVFTDNLFRILIPVWYGAEQLEFERAINENLTFTPSIGILIFQLFRSAVISIICGFVAAVIAGENRRSALILGLGLLIFGVFVQALLWNHFPIWYHLLFLALLLPLTLVGGRLKTARPT
ncbi:MAG TPA: hypothetical protein VNK26_01235 [Pyrinomonadaceae bacterium]|jgi:hypothetical protein|nr:hypothetical protein [Pyrinomonadaceae bacterium]